MNVALVCIAKNEDPYLDEWISYNKKIGFDDIIIYQNDWRYAKEHDNVVKIPFDGEYQQMNAYNHFIQKNKKYDWVAFFDVDEFLVLKKHKNIKDFLKDYLDCSCVCINWALFGDNGHEKIVNNDYSVLKRFTKRKKDPFSHVKSIINLSYNAIMLQPHNPCNIIQYDTNKNKFQGPLNPNADFEIAQINHYFTKTKEEFIKKVDRGRADTPKHLKRKLSEFDDHNFNEVDDFFAYNFFSDKQI